MGFDNPPVPWKELEQRLSWGGTPVAGDAPPRPEAPARPAPAVRPPSGGPEWAELHVHSSFSFLDGVCTPAELVAEAARLGIGTLGLTDHDGMYGAVQFAAAAKEAGVATVFGAELSLDLPAPQNGRPDPAGSHLLVLARDPEGYRRLCAAISEAQLAGGAKGRPVYDLDSLSRAHGGHWAVLTGCRKGGVPAALAADGPDAALARLHDLRDRFGADNVHVELTDHGHPLDDARNDALADLAARAGAGLVASCNAHYAAPRDAPLAQALAAVRARRGLDDMESWLSAAGGAHLRSGAEMAARTARFPGAVAATAALGRACAFDLTVIAPRLPDSPVPEGHTEASLLRELAAQGAERRYGPRGSPGTADCYAQIERELDLIASLGFPGYFLIVHDIVQFCERNGILCQGRGSAANSAVCYAIGITNVDPVRHELLFERFLSAERDGPPDIDLDIEHRRREEVIQYVYDRYGRERAAQVANVITYRPRMAVRDAARALGHSPGQQDSWSRLVDSRDWDPDDPESRGVPRPVASLAQRMLRLPRHLGIHSGGMVICDRPVGEVCPVEWASMPGRSVLQWDKDDCAAAGLVKFDLLGLGMLACLHDAFDLIADHHGVRYTLGDIPTEDPATYAMLCGADTVGVFQVESRAQMSTLPRLRPERFYDLVVAVALIRPGPIQGGSVHPYLRRRDKLEPAECPHPLMEPALGRTLGVPLFQEQMMQLAIDCAGFTPTEADLLRQAMGSKRAPEKVHELRERLLRGMAANGITPEVAEDVYTKILAFSNYGFPESHAISFAHLAYASAWIKRHYPAAFTAALLRNQPMGFYHPQTLIADARRHGIEVLRADVNASADQATVEGPGRVVRTRHPHAPQAPQPAVRLGLDSVRDLGGPAAEAVAAGRPYTGLADFARRTRLSEKALEALATADAFRCFGLSRREALWAAGAVARARNGQLPDMLPGTEPPGLEPMTPVEETLADLWSTGTSAVHPIAHLRPALERRRVLAARALASVPDGTGVEAAGQVTHRQRPETAGGVVFISLEDETGMVNVVCPPEVWRRCKGAGARSAALLVGGRLERRNGAINLVAARLEALPAPTVAQSRDFH
ncbi:DnaE-like error-prone DNA polymerase [Murinocardiopsis flavida]|uniref:Error-prone DNA polymerase n=1 Tax=Murinocardiopsis flavida TaxID=645275 RepID=A0A2P8DKN7_9ACTN|nr:error-prone DNA polymerase [Murinocardiopsis flavida]PSK97792.1 DnaE-like error-prone DNA polymerase [Murinocardiopsis flavida]